jgi:hypothetical protein
VRCSFAPRPLAQPQKQLRPARQLRALAHPPPSFPPPAFRTGISVKLRRSRQLCAAVAGSAPKSSSADPANFATPPPSSAPQLRPLRARSAAASFRPLRPAARRSPTPSSADGHERLRATFAPRFPGNTGPSKVFARKSPPPSQSPASFGDGHPSTHGAASRRRTGTGQGPTSAWLRPAPPHEQFAAPQHRRAGRTKRGQRSSRSTQFHAVPPHQQLAAQQYRFSAQRSTAFRHTAVPQFRSTSSSQQTFLTTIEYSPSRHIGRSLRRAPGSFRTPGPAGRTPCIASARGSAVSIASRPWQLPGTLLRLSHAHQENPQL